MNIGAYIESLATLIAGIGLLFSGIRIVGNSLKRLASRKFRLLVTKWTGHKILSSFWGFLSGMISQSSANTTFIMVSLISSGLMTLRAAIPIVSFSYVGSAVLIFLVAFNIKLGILFLIGISGIFYGLVKGQNRQNLFSALLGISLLLFGFILIKSGAAPIAQLDWMQILIEKASSSLLIPFIIGAVLRLISQSSSSVTVLVMTMISTGIIDIHQVMLTIYGSFIGSALSVMFLSTNIKGTARQLILFSIYFDLTGAVLTVLLFVLEYYLHIPLILSLVNLITSDPEQQIAFIYLFRQLVPTLFIILFAKVYEKLIIKLSPATMEEDLSKVKYLYDQGLNDPETAMDLVEMEQKRILSRFSKYLENINGIEYVSSEKINTDTLNKANIEVFTEIKSFLSSIANNNISHKTSERLLNLQNQLGRLEAMDESLFNIAKVLDNNISSVYLNGLLTNFTEGLHAILTSAGEAVTTDDEFDLDMLIKITGDKDSLMEKIRKTYLTNNQNLTNEDKVSLLFITDLFQRLVWLMNKWASLHLRLVKAKELND